MILLSADLLMWIHSLNNLFFFVWQAMVTRFPSISTRKLSNALTVLTCNKSMVATSDYDDFHKLVKRCILNGLLGANAQVRVHSFFTLQLRFNILFVVKS